MPLSKLFNPTIKPPPWKALEDPTLYKIVTQTDTYCGRISYQDNVMMWLTSCNKPVKIMKENIVRITII